MLLLSAVLLSPGLNTAQEIKKKKFESIEFLTGYSWGELREKEDYEFIPFLVDFNFDLKPFIQRLNIYPKQTVQFQLEPFVSFVSSPGSNLEMGTSFLLKIGLAPEKWKFKPYVKGGVGLVYMTQHTQEQGSQFNFTEQLGLGIQYLLTQNIAFNLEYRRRHLSNASIEQPNKGIESNFILGGLTYRF